MSNIIEKLGLANDVKEITLGKSFTNNEGSYFHTFRYDFKPASVDSKKVATVDIGERNQVTVSVPYVDKGSGSGHAVFKGSKKPYNKECVLIIDHQTGSITLEKLTHNVQLKKTRAEGTSKIKNSVLENNLNPSGKRGSPVPKEKSFSSKLNNWSNSHFVTPASKCSPLPKSPNSQSSPPDRTSPTMPANTSTTAAASTSSTVNVFESRDKLRSNVAMECPEIGVLSSDNSSSEDEDVNEDNDSNSSSSESSSDGEGVEAIDHDAFNSKVMSLPGSSKNQNYNSNSTKNGMSSNQNVPHFLPSMPKFSELNEDLKLSESDSDDD